MYIVQKDILYVSFVLILCSFSVVLPPLKISHIFQGREVDHLYIIHFALRHGLKKEKRKHQFSAYNTKLAVFLRSCNVL